MKGEEMIERHILGIYCYEDYWISFGDPSSWIYHAIYAPTIDGEK